ncbi:MAG: hypothetical protein KIH63_004680 [Candidatus Saccharibacteria bacterium]|nr:hypothetical protein [Candidatus Saccharibacteria bacterium]
MEKRVVYGFLIVIAMLLIGIACITTASREDNIVDNGEVWVKVEPTIFVLPDGSYFIPEIEALIEDGWTIEIIEKGIRDAQSGRKCVPAKKQKKA